MIHTSIYQNTEVHIYTCKQPWNSVRILASEVACSGASHWNLFWLIFMGLRGQILATGEG